MSNHNKKFTIHHPYDGQLNTSCVPAQYMYKQVATVEATSLEHAFFLGQNDYNSKYQLLGNRSTSVGDIIKDQDNNCYLVNGTGFSQITNRWLTFIDWGIVEQQRELV